MNRCQRAAAAVATIVLGSGVVGCMSSDRPGFQNRYAGWADPCWPERYNYEARKGVIAPFASHVENGRVMEHTLFNHHFEQGTEKLTPAGTEKLDALTRSRPMPDSHLYLQTARDVPFDAANADRYVTVRSELDNKRIQTVQKYLAATLSGRQVAMDVQVIDPSEPLMNAQGPATSARSLPARYTATLGQGGGGTAQGGAGGGAAGGASGGGGGGTGGR